VLNKPASAEAICGELVEYALEQGGKDNITVIVVRTSES
jgi:serine/threonine protein phosphatase PrpC